MTIDLEAERVIFNDSDINIWQVPRDVYRQMLFSHAELSQMAAKSGPLGQFLLKQIDNVNDNVIKKGFMKRGIGEAYVLGDSPLVTLTALQSSFQPDTSSCRYALRPTPMLDMKGNYRHRRAGRTMRVYQEIDCRLTFDDMVAKFETAGQQEAPAQ